ncbi:MAG: DNA cytosine methyltransferase [Euryarchaeota archaeon]|jgi:DNA (cytosine-5)-methyltransferase 1|nr:DNA cytosine methyltransferase [Euryarchaeota archaeon]
MRKPTSIDLFAGCGGLTRGLEWAGYECLAFNELNKDAADSFAANFPEAIRLDGDIRSALTDEVITKQLLPLIDKKGGLDLLCGGPPCQGYSGIGHRRTHKLEKKDIPTNHLFLEMISAISRLQPRVFLFENVEGILSGKWTTDGAKGEIFRDVWESFSQIEGYVVQPTLLHAYGFGVPQNRPRVMIMGVREELLEHCEFEPVDFNPNTNNQSYASQLRNNGGFFPSWDENNINAPDLIDVLSDLDFEGWTPDKPHYRKKPKTDFQKFLRNEVQTNGRGRQILTDHEFSNHKPHVVERFQYMLDNNVTKKADLPPHMQTRKFNQKPLPARWPNKPSMTVTSLPDDYVHYRRARTFSVREWARLQTFPDKHIFCGKRTTGGERRAGNPAEGNWNRDVPKYTQIGNAVPPLLGKALGEQIALILPSLT